MLCCVVSCGSFLRADKQVSLCGWRRYLEGEAGSQLITLHVSTIFFYLSLWPAWNWKEGQLRYSGRFWNLCTAGLIWKCSGRGPRIIRASGTLLAVMTEDRKIGPFDLGFTEENYWHNPAGGSFPGARQNLGPARGAPAVGGKGRTLELI